MQTVLFGKRIANGRKEKGLTQEDLAEMLYVTPQAVSKWERGESLPDIFMLAKISDIFGVYDIGYFIGEMNYPCRENEIKGGEKMNSNCENFTSIEQFVEYWQSCSVKGLQKICLKYDVKFDEKDTKEQLVAKLKKSMEEHC